MKTVGGSAFALRVEGLEKHFESFSLGPVSLDVPSGSVVGLVGQNGAGKSTLMKTALGMLRADAGRVELLGVDTTGLADAERAKVREGVGYVASQNAYPRGMTVGEVERMFALAYPTFDAAAFDGLSMRLEVGDKGRKVGDLSRGTGMKLQLALCMAAGVSLLVLDEPTAGLDPLVRRDALDALRTWMEPTGRSVLISSHITSDLDRMADVLVLIDKGRVLLMRRQDELEDMGVARLRRTELDRVLADGTYGVGELRMISRELSVEMLVPSRAAFVRAYPDFVCDPASIDDVMAFYVKGEVR